MIYKGNSAIRHCDAVFGSFFDKFKALATASFKKVYINNGY